MSVYSDVLAEQFNGVLSHGSHAPDGVACALEVASVARGAVWSDNPATVGLPDLRSINDASWSTPAVRTATMVPLIEALWDWPEWTPEHRTAYVGRVVFRTIREILPPMLRHVGLNVQADACETATDLEAAGAAWAAAGAAEAAAWAAAATEAARAADDVLILACRIWIEEAVA